MLSNHSWPGNVRELENALRAASLFAETDVIGPRELVENVDDLRKAYERVEPSRPRSRPEMQAVADEVGGSVVVPTPPCSAARSTLTALPDDGDELGSEEGPLPSLPSGEAQATAVAYAQVRQGALSLADLKRQIERDCIARALTETKGNITKAASLLGMKRPRLSQLVKHYGLSAVSSETS